MHTSAAADDTCTTPSAVAEKARLCEMVNAVSASEHAAHVAQQQHEQQQEQQVIVAGDDVEQAEPDELARDRSSRRAHRPQLEHAGIADQLRRGRAIGERRDDHRIADDRPEPANR